MWALLSIGTLALFALRESRRRALASLRAETARTGESSGPRSHRLLEAIAADPTLTSEEAAPACAIVLAGPRGGRIRTAASSGSPARRISALRILVRGRDPDAPELLRRALFAGDPAISPPAAALLGMDGRRRCAEILVEALVADAYVSSRLATAIERTRVPCDELLLPLLSDPSPRLRYWGACLLAPYAGQLPVSRALAALSSDPDPKIRKAAIQSLRGAKGSPEAAAAAKRLLRDPVDFVRAHAGAALAAIEGASA